MLLTNQHLDKLMAARIEFTRRGMLEEADLRASLEKLGSSYVIGAEHGNSDKLYRARAGGVQ
jgi:hypothetical protein